MTKIMTTAEWHATRGPDPDRMLDYHTNVSIKFTYEMAAARHALKKGVAAGLDPAAIVDLINKAMADIRANRDAIDAAGGIAPAVKEGRII